jgi:thiol:disulfide interchange protein
MQFKKSPFVLCLIGFLFITSSVFAQPSWKDKMTLDYSLIKDGDCQVTIKFKAKLIPGFHVFSVSHDPEKADFTGTPTTIEVEPSKNFKLIGKLSESKKPTVHKDEFGTSLYFENSVEFLQKVEVLTDKSFTMDVRLAGQICDELGCVFMNKDFKIVFKNYKPCSVTEVAEENTSQAISTNDTTSKTVADNTEKVSSKYPTEEMKEVRPSKKQADSFWITFLKGFGGGLIALLTPCVFPMIPMTVTFFTKQSGSRKKGIINVLLYGVSIILIYVTIGLVITAIMGPSGLNDLSTNVWMNLLFFSIFMIFAFSFLGAFEIRMPSKWVNKADGNADKGGLIGIFFMAFTLSLVSFSCTGPIIGTLLVESSTSGSMMGPAIGMIGFSSALAIPFTLFAIFPGWLNSLPQSGGWLNSVKVVLGLLELALALKFLSGIDLAYHWGVLTREIFIAIWIVIFFVIGFYLLGKIKFSHDSNVERLTVTRFMFALLALVFAVYLVPGMWGAPLKLIDGVAPPRTHSEDNFRFSRGESGGGGTAISDPIFQEYRKDMHEVDGDILVFHDLDIAQEYAKKVNKPVLLDFTGYNCPNCRRTESTVWTDEKISPILKNEVIIVSLYVDDKAKLPKSEWKFSKALDSEIRTVGNKWGDYQIRKYNQLSQPLYVLTDPEGNDLTKPMGYEPNIDVYKSFLENGLKKYKK